MAGVAASGRKRAKWGPYLMCTPALAYLFVFFVLPLWTLLKTSLSVNTGSVFLPTLQFNWHWANYTDALSRYQPQVERAFGYAAIATVICLIMSYPLAYFIAFKAGRAKNFMLGLVILPFFVTFLVRTLAWKTILADDGWVVSVLTTLHLTPSGGRVLSTPMAVIGGLVYNFLPFMILPIYVSLDKIDERLIEAARDLYSTSRRAFMKVVLPLSLPGVFAGTLLTFIPASGDFINAEYLGSTQTTVIGTVIQKQFLVVKDYPLAAALSFVLMTIILIMVLVYSKILGTEDLV
jgi:spermidine/putrescine transport system permease protein